MFEGEQVGPPGSCLDIESLKKKCADRLHGVMKLPRGIYDVKKAEIRCSPSFTSGGGLFKRPRRIDGQLSSRVCTSQRTQSVMRSVNACLLCVL